MSTLQEAQQELQSQEAALSAAREASQQQQQATEAARSKLPDVNAQAALRGQTFSQGIQGQVQRANVQSIANQLNQRLQDLQNYNQQLNQYETDTLNPFKQQVQDYQNQLDAYNSAVQAYQAQVQAYTVANNAFTSNNPTAILGILSSGGQAATYLKQMLQAQNSFNQNQIIGGTTPSAPTNPFANSAINPATGTPFSPVPSFNANNTGIINQTQNVAATVPRQQQSIFSSILNAIEGYPAYYINSNINTLRTIGQTVTKTAINPPVSLLSPTSNALVPINNPTSPVVGSSVLGGTTPLAPQPSFNVNSFLIPNAEVPNAISAFQAGVPNAYQPPPNTPYSTFIPSPSNIQTALEATQAPAVQAAALTQNQFGTYSFGNQPQSINPASLSFGQRAEYALSQLPQAQSIPSYLSTIAPVVFANQGTSTIYPYSQFPNANTTFVGNLKTDYIKKQLIAEGIAPTEQNIQLYKQNVNPFTSPLLSVASVTGIGKYSIVGENGKPMPSLGSTTSDLGNLNVPSLLLSAAAFTPAGISVPEVNFNPFKTIYKFEKINAGLPEKPTVLVSRPLSETTYANPITGEIETQTTQDILMGVQRTVKEGQKTIVTTPIRDFFGIKPIYEGNPYADLSGYQSALKLLKDQGYTEIQARNILQLRRPQYAVDVFGGKVQSVFPEESKQTVSLTGIQKTGFASGKIDNVPVLTKPTYYSAISASGSPQGDFFRFTSSEKKLINNLIEQGKSTTTYDVLAQARQVKEFPSGTIKYSQSELSRQIIPSKRGTSFETSNVYVASGKPDITVVDESILPSKGFNGGGSKSSQQFFKNLYKQSNENAVSLSNALNKPKPITPRIPKVTASSEFASTTSYPVYPISIYTGTNTYERTSGGISPPAIKGNVLVPTSNPSIDITNVKPTDFTSGSYRSDLTQTYGDFASVKPQELTLTSNLQPQELKQPQVQNDLVRQTQPQTQEFKQSQKENQSQSQALIQPQAQQQTQSNFRIKPRITTPSISAFGKSSEENRRRKDLFEALVKRFGKFRSIGKFSTQSAAENAEKNFLKNTISATAETTFRGQPVKPLSFGSNFRPSRTGNPYLIIERKGGREGGAGRLSTRGAQAEIKSARNKFFKKTKKVKF